MGIPMDEEEGTTIMKFTKMQGLGNDYVYVNCLMRRSRIRPLWR